MNQDLRTVITSASRVLAAAALGLALQPAIALPGVLSVIGDCLIALAVIGVAAGAGAVILALAYFAEKAHRNLPPQLEAPRELMQFATTHDAAQLAEANYLAAEESHIADDDRDAQWEAGLLRFALAANPRFFGWRDMCRHVSRTDWENCRRILLAIRPRVVVPPRGNEGMRWAEGWGFPRFRLSVKHGNLHPPYPDTEPPLVEWKRTVTLGKHVPHVPHTEGGQA